MARMLGKMFSNLLIKSNSRVHVIRYASTPNVKLVAKKMYGISSLNEYRHVHLFSALKLNDATPDRFYTGQEIQSVTVDFYKPVSISIYKNAVTASLNLKRPKLAVSLVDFVLSNDLFENQFLKLAINVLSTAFVEKAITKDYGRKLADKVKLATSDASDLLKQEVDVNLSLFYEAEESASIVLNMSNLFLAKIADAIRNRNIEMLTTEWKNHPAELIHETSVFRDFIRWMETDKQNTSKLLNLFMSSLTNSQVYLDSKTFDCYIKPIASIAHLPEIKRVRLDNSKCNHCGEYFDPKPKLSAQEWAKLNPLVNKYAERIGCLRNDNHPWIVKKLAEMKASDPLKRPICYFDIANIAYGKHSYLGNVQKIIAFVGSMYQHFSGIALITKFSVPQNIYQQLNQLRTVFCRTKNRKDDIEILQLYTAGAADDYIVTNDLFRDHSQWIHLLDNSSSFRKALQLRSIRFVDNVIEVPVELSPFVQPTLTGFHLPVRQPIVRNQPSYEYYCLHGSS